MFTLENREHTEAAIRDIIETEYNTEIIENEDNLVFSIDFICFHKDYSDKVTAIIEDKWGYKVNVKMLSKCNQIIAHIKIEHDLFSKEPTLYCYYVQTEILRNFIPIVVVHKTGQGEFVYRNFIVKFNKTYSKDFYRSDLNFAPKSSWEANIARVLNYLAIPFEYERNSFECFNVNTKEHNGYYFPDFFLPNDILIEVKGFWNPDSRKKVYELSKFYCNENNLSTALRAVGTIYKLYIIDYDIYSTLSKMYRGLISDWEKDELALSRKEKVQVVGLSFGNRKLTFNTLMVGQEVILKRDIDNSYDKNAILVYTNEMREIGFVSADWACIYAPKMDIGMKYDAYIISIEPKVINIEVSRGNNDLIVMFDLLMPRITEYE